ncbi:hypothetical protein RRG08_025555 [Elysia crispata]|uniref:Ig-like domain-containing protein n=1 Tax=Elysia crispata TaxID=231223 RepID=A0AAE1DFW1_9GAST|nr:hypothetical protein RRG08_025555 [Elysia crispata]
MSFPFSVLRLLLLTIFFPLIAAQSDPSNPSALSTKEFIRNGEVIEFNCNADVVQVPSQFIQINGLTISRQLHGSTEMVVVAIYTFGNFGKQEGKNPNSRDWTFDFKEPLNPTVSTRDSNIKWTMKDATCADAAMYECKVGYNGDAPLLTLLGHQNVSARAAVRNLFVTIDPQNANFRYSENDNVTMACTVEGPPGLLIVWRSGYPNSGLFQDYSVAADIVEDNPSPVSTDACGAMMYRSSLSIMLTNNDNGLMYVCAARYDNDPELVDNITLSVGPSDPGGPAPSTSGSNDTGMIVGIVFGILAFIIIVLLLVYFCWYRKRKDGNEDKDAERDDTKPDMHAPPPVFYSKPNKPPKDDRDDNTWGKDSDANDTWGRKPRYDTYDDDKGDDHNRRKPSSSSSGGRKLRQGSASSAVRDRDGYPSRSAYDDDDNGYGPDNKNDSYDSYSKPRYEKRKPRESSNSQAQMTTTDVSGRSEDEASDSPLNGSRQRPRPKRRTSRPSSASEDRDDQRGTSRRGDRERERGREGERQGDPALHYAQLDLAPSSDRERGRRGGRRNDKSNDQPVEYAEIRV